MNVQIALLNGLTCELPLLPSSTVQDLRAAAHEAFGQKYLKLVTADKRILVNPQETLEEAEIKDGECVTALVVKPQVATTEQAFASWSHGDTAIVTRGSAEFGGDGSAVQNQLRRVQQIQATQRAFVLQFWQVGSVVTWGIYVQQIQATDGAFAASCDFGRWISRHLG